MNPIALKDKISKQFPPLRFLKGIKEIDLTMNNYKVHVFEKSYCIICTLQKKKIHVRHTNDGCCFITRLHTHTCATCILHVHVLIHQST